MSERSRADAAYVAAVALQGSQPTPGQLLDVARGIEPWIKHGDLVLSVSSITYEQGSSTSSPTIATKQGDVTVATMKDTQQYTASVSPEDAKGFAEPDNITWSADDGGAVVTLQPSSDTLSCLIVAVAPGTANYQATDGTVTAAGSAVVVPGDVSQLVVSESAPEDQPAPTPPAGP
jgi:hypothetical protein